jgi:peptidoglycan-N-acetylglucosamine deacetylase
VFELRRPSLAWGLVAVGVALSVVTAVAVWRREPDLLVLNVNGRPIAIDSPYTVRHALKRAGLRSPHDGALRAAASRKVLDPKWNRGDVEDSHHRRLRLGAQVAPGETIRVHNGVDAIEATSDREIPIPTTGLPPIEHELWNPGTTGIADAAVGTRSGEPVNQKVLRDPVPASRMPDKVVALSFDDGPDPTFTPQVLSVLQQFGVKATFCVIGRAARQHPDLVRAIRDQGHLLCDHTESHPHLDRVAPGQLGDQIAGPVAYCQLVLGQHLAFMRPPYGSTNQAVVDTARNQGLRVLEWSVDPKDYTKPPAGTIVSRVVGAVRPGGIVLMHDGGGDRSQTVAALPVIITQLQAQGYRFAQPRT